MENKLKEEMLEMKIPREKIQQRIELGVTQAGDKMNHVTTDQLKGYLAKSSVHLKPSSLA